MKAKTVKVVDGYNLVKVDGTAAEMSVPDGRFGTLNRLFAGAIAAAAYNRNSCASTFIRNDGNLIHTQTASEHQRYKKTPDVTYVGSGMWEHEKNVKYNGLGWVRK